MKHMSSLLLLVSMAAFAADEYKLPEPGPDGWISIFNGKDLEGWYGEESVFKVDAGEIVGKSETGLKRNEFLKSKFSVSDFRLVLKIKVTPDKENSGIQIRSEPFKGHEMKGYQADAGAGWWGKLYEESGRGLLWKDERGLKAYKADDWNTYEIVAIGSKVKTYVNGTLCVDLDDDKGAKSGIFGLQVHSGGPVEVRWKDLKLQLNPKDLEPTAK